MTLIKNQFGGLTNYQASVPDVLLVIVVLANHANLRQAKERLLKCYCLVDIVSDAQNCWSRHFGGL